MASEAQLHLPYLTDSNNSPIKIVRCSCGIVCGSTELYFHHLECTQSNNKHLPRDASLWPLRFFKTIPNISLCQRGCIARNSEYNNVEYIVIWLNRLQSNSNNLTFSNAFINKALPKLKSFIVSIPLQSTKDTSNQNQSIATMIALSNDLWELIVNTTDNKLHSPKELKQFKSKYSYINTEQCILPIYDEDMKQTETENAAPVHTRTQPDIFIMIKCNDPNNNITDKCLNILDKSMIAHMEQTNGFKYKGGKDLTGFIDGTKNMDYNLRDLTETVLINDKQNLCGSYVYCSRFIHDLTKFHQLSTNDKSAIIGRKYGVETASKSLDGRKENPRTGLDLKGHVFRAWGEMYRQSYPYKTAITVDEKKGEECEQGLFFCCYSHSLDEIDTSLERMMGKWGTGKQKGLDNLFRITRSLFNGYFYAPSLRELSLLQCSDGSYLNELEEWMNVRYNEVENAVVIPEKNYVANMLIQQTCQVCEREQSVLSDEHSQIYFCLECRNVGSKL